MPPTISLFELKCQSRKKKPLSEFEKFSEGRIRNYYDRIT
jgi:hypothetical protein